ncbi:MAG: OmpA family protein [Proteobacteria bacterium]|nr:OmpA family protein [Pseudomonadota bacterium]
MRLWIAAVLVAAALVPMSASAGVFVGQNKDLLNPDQGEQPIVTLGFDEKLHRATVTITGDGTPFSQTWNFPGAGPGREYELTWKQQPGIEVDYTVSVEMVSSNGEKYTEEVWVYFASARPITARIPVESVDMEAKAFDLVSNHPPSRVELEVIDDRMKTIGQSTFKVTEATPGSPVRVTWEQQMDGNIFKITATAYDKFGYWAGVEIIPWSLSIPHEDVNFASGKHDVVAEEAPKVDDAYEEIVKAVDKYGEWVTCTLFIGGYTDTVGDAGSNQGLSERRARALAQYFQSKGAKFPIYYQGFGESVLAVQTEDSVDMKANRRALYIITAGTPPVTKETPRGNWKKIQ